MSYDEDEEEDDFDLKGEMREGYVVGDARGGGYDVSYSGRHAGHGDSISDALVYVQKRMEKESYFPNVFYVNDRGNVDLIVIKAKMRNGKIVSADYETIRSWV